MTVRFERYIYENPQAHFSIAKGTYQNIEAFSVKTLWGVALIFVEERSGRKPPAVLVAQIDDGMYQPKRVVNAADFIAKEMHRQKFGKINALFLRHQENLSASEFILRCFQKAGVIFARVQSHDYGERTIGVRLADGALLQERKKLRKYQMVELTSEGQHMIDRHVGGDRLYVTLALTAKRLNPFDKDMPGEAEKNTQYTSVLPALDLTAKRLTCKLVKKTQLI